MVVYGKLKMVLNDWSGFVLVVYRSSHGLFHGT